MALGDMEQFSLRWNNFHSNLTSGFQSLLAEEDLVDVTLAAGGGVVQAHKIILSICSPYFKQLFKVNPCKHPIVILKDVQHKDLVDILQFMYQGEVNVRQEDLGAFLKTAELLQIKGLTGQDSPAEPSSERETPVVANQSLDRIVPRIRPPRRRIDKPPQPAMPRLEKQPSPRAQSPLPPYKRMRAETPVVLSDDTSGVECIDLKSPKMEPVDCEPSAEPEPPSEGSSKDGIMDEALGGESSRHSLQDSKQGLTSEPELKDSPALSLLQQHSTMSPDARSLGLSPSVSGAASETNTSQDGESGLLHYVESRKGRLQLVHDGYLYGLLEQKGVKRYWRCLEYPRTGCRGFCKTMAETDVAMTRPHNHVRQHDKIRERAEQAQRRNQMSMCNTVDMLSLSGAPQFVESRKGKLQLVMAGFIYNLINPRERRQYWRCTEYSKKGCRGHITMMENRIVSLSPQPHNHEPLHDRIRFKMEMTRLKQQFQLEKLHLQQPQLFGPMR